MKYCLECGCMVEMYWTSFHLKTIRTSSEAVLGGDDITLAIDCHGPFAECPPPDKPLEGWQDKLIGPAADEFYNVKFDFDIEQDQIIMLELI